jgi:hypothetical protein
MATIKINIVVADLVNVREQFDRLKVYRSTTGLTGAYTELTDGSTRIPLEESRTIYDFEDTSGASTYFYRISYFNSVSTLESSLSDPQQGEQDSALSVISVEDLKTNFLFGVDCTDDQGTPFPDSMYEFYIKSAVSFIEAKLDLPIRPLEVTEEMHDYYEGDYRSYMSLDLDHYPVISIQSVKLQLPGSSTANMTYDSSWISLQKEAGQMHIIPGSGGGGMAALGIHPKALLGARWIPNCFRVSYTAGFEVGRCPAAIRELVGKIASYGPLNVAGDLVGGAGLAGSSLSIDGLSQSITTTNSSTNAGFGARLIMYRKEVKDQLDVLARYYKGLRLAVA